MRALLAAVGTRGDVQPALALALELRKLGHSVRLCTSPNFVAWAQRLGLEAYPMGVEMRAPAQGAKLTPDELRKLRESMPDLIADQFETLGAAANGCDVILGANAHQYAAPSIAAHAGIRCVTALYAPTSMPSATLAPPPLPGRATIPSASIQEQWRQTAQAWNERALARVNQQRDRLGLHPIADVLDYVLTDHPWLAADRALGPAAETSGKPLFQTGSWVLADNTPLPADVEAFLARGDAPVLVGFGSMPASSELRDQLITAIRSLGCRFILSRGWAGLELIDNASDCIAIGDVSYDMLFPRLSAVVHHGGAGTTATAARAGVPQLVLPMFSDQFYWAHRIAELGLGATLANAAALQAMLPAVLAPEVAARARTFAQHMPWDGARVAAEQLVRLTTQ